MRGRSACANLKGRLKIVIRGKEQGSFAKSTKSANKQVCQINKSLDVTLVIEIK